MANTIKLKRGSGSDPSASDLAVGELAIRTDSGKIFTKKDNGSVAEISGGGGISDGDKGDITVSNGGDTFTIDNGVVTSAKIADGTIVNADVNASAAIAGSKIDPDFGSQNIVTTGNLTGGNSLTLSGTAPVIEFTETNGDPDFKIQGNAGKLRFTDTTNGVERMTINTDGHIDIAGNLDVGAGLDLTGNMTVSGTVDGVDIATLNTLVNTINTNVASNTSKLNTIETGATADQSASDIKTLLQSNKLTASEIQNDTITAVQLANGAANVNVILDGAIVNSKVNGSAAIAGTKIDPDFGSQNIDTSGNITSPVLVAQGASGSGDGIILINSGGGANNDFSRIRQVLSDDSFVIENKSSGSYESFFKGNSSRGAELHFQGSKKLETLTGGVSVTGDFTISSSFPRIYLTDTNSDSDFSIFNGNGTFTIKDETNNANRIRLFSGGGVQIDGNLDATAGLDVTGAITSTGNLTITNTLPTIFLTDSDHDSDFKIANQNGVLKFIDATNSADRFTIASNGNISAGGTITSTFSGNLTGNVTGNTSGSSGSCTGNAATATKLANARTIAGVSFDGSQNISLNNNAITNGAGYLTSVDTSDITNNAVDFDKIQVVGTNKIIGRVSGGNGNIEALTPAQIRSLLGVVQNDNNFTDTLLSKLNGIASGATNVTNNNQLTNGAGYITSSSAGIPASGGTFTGDVTFSGGAGAISVSANSDIRLTSGTWSGNTTKIQHHSNILYIVGGSSGIIFRESGTDRWTIDGDGHFRPSANNTYDIGSTGNRVKNIYTNDLHLSNEGSSNKVDGTWGDWTLQEGENQIFMLNNRNGKKYSINLTEIV